jgi:sec-independent protein translocase protein TatA
MDVGVPELLIILAVVLLVFGSTRVPKLARSLGEASREFRRGATEPGADPGADSGTGTGEPG